MRPLRERWLRRRTLIPDPINLVSGLGYTMAVAPSNNGEQPLRHLTNNNVPDGTTGSFGRFDCHSWNNVASTMVFDLTEPQLVNAVGVYGIVNVGGGIRTPDSISLSSSPDNATWTTRASASLPTESGTTWSWVTDVAPHAERYWRISQTPQSGLWCAVGEVQLLSL